MKLGLLFGLMLISRQLLAAEPLLRICDDEALWPPFIYKDKTAITEPVSGILIDLLNEILAPTKINYQIELIPWQRCLAEVQNFAATGQFEMLINATVNKQRQASYLYSDSIYSLQLGYFYSQKRFPQGLSISHSNQMKPFTLCGVRGFNYAPYLLPSGLQVDTGAANLDAALKKLDSGRCDLLLSSSYPILASQKAGLLHIPKSIKAANLNYLKANQFHFLVSKGSNRSKQLISILNEGLKRVKNNGKYQEILSKYFNTD